MTTIIYFLSISWFFFSCAGPHHETQRWILRESAVQNSSCRLVAPIAFTKCHQPFFLFHPYIYFLYLEAHPGAPGSLRSSVRKLGHKNARASVTNLEVHCWQSTSQKPKARGTYHGILEVKCCWMAFGNKNQPRLPFGVATTHFWEFSGPNHHFHFEVQVGPA